MIRCRRFCGMAPGDCCPPQPFQRLRQRNLTWGYWCQGGIGLPFRRDGIRSSSPSLGCSASRRITCAENNAVEAEHRGRRSSRADCRPEENLIAEAGEPTDQVAGAGLGGMGPVFGARHVQPRFRSVTIHPGSGDSAQGRARLRRIASWPRLSPPPGWPGSGFHTKSA
jgi:hypothetical protein